MAQGNTVPRGKEKRTNQKQNETKQSKTKGYPNIHNYLFTPK